MQWEINFLRWIVENTHNPFITEFFKLYTILGKGAAIFFLASFLMIIFKKTRKAGLIILFGLVFVAGLNNFILKPIIHRSRPFYGENDGLTVLATFVENFRQKSSINDFTVPGPTSYSFMSGHTLSAFIFGFTVAIYHKKWAIPAILASALMAYTRIYFAFHYPTDIIAGIITALATSFGLAYIANKYETQIINNFYKRFPKKKDDINEA